MTPLRTAWALAIVVVWAGTLQSAPSPLAVFPPGVKRIVVLGDSITYGGTYVVYLEAYFRSRHPGQFLEFINLGLPSETVSGLSEPGHAGGKFPRPVLRERLTRSLAATKPDFVIACYGMNDGIYLPFAEERFEAFRNGITELHAAVLRLGCPFLLMTPPTFDAKNDTDNTYNAVLAQYGEWELGRKSDGWDVVDLNRTMTAALAAKRRTQPEYAFSKDGVHPNADGHWIMARQILEHLGARDLTNVAEGSALLEGIAQGDKILTLITQRQTLFKDAWLNQIGHERPGMKRSARVSEVEDTAAALDREIRALLPAQRGTGASK